MADQNLLNYINAAFSQGMTKEQISQELIRAGWQPAMVEEGFQSLLSGFTTPLENVESKKKLPPHFFRWLVIGGSLAIVIIAFFIFKDKLFTKPQETNDQVAQVQNAKSATPFITVEDQLKLLDYSDTYSHYEIVYSKNKDCFALVLQSKVDKNTSKVPETGFGPIALYNFVWFKDKVMGPLSISSLDSINFSDDCTTVVFPALKEDGVPHIYKNGEQVSFAGLENSKGEDSFTFEPKSKRIFYINEKNFFVDSNKFGPYNVIGQIGLGDIHFLKFDTSGNNYALKVRENNPEFELFVAKNTKIKLGGSNAALQDIESDPNLSQEEKSKRINDIMSKMSPEEIEKVFNEIDSTEATLEQLKLAEEFKKTNWVTREFLIVNGKQTEPFETIFDFHFTTNGDLRYIAGKQDGDYLFHNGKLEQIAKYSSSDSLRKSYENFKSSPDGKRYAYSLMTYKAINENTINNLRNEALAGKDLAESEKYKNKYQVVIDGKVSEEYSGSPSKDLVFSPDGQHVAYMVSKDDNSQYVMYDGKKLGPFSHISSGYYNSLFTFSPDNKLYFYTYSSNDESCVYVEGQKSNCHSGSFYNFTFQEGSFSYLNKYAEGQTGRYSIIFNGKVYGPYEGIDKLIISPDGTKFLHTAYDTKEIFLNGELIQSGSAFGGDLEQLIFFTPDSQHVVYSNRPSATEIEIKVDKDQIKERITTPALTVEGYSDEVDELTRPGYLMPAPDKKSVWYIFNDRDTKQLMVKNIKLGL